MAHISNPGSVSRRSKDAQTRASAVCCYRTYADNIRYVDIFTANLPTSSLADDMIPDDEVTLVQGYTGPQGHTGPTVGHVGRTKA